MKELYKLIKYRIFLDNREIKPVKRNFLREKKRVALISFIFSILLFFVIYYTLPLTILSISGLFVYASVVSLVVFLLILLLRYFLILFMSYFNLTKYTFKKNDDFHPFVSIIVPLYNEGEMVRKSIESLLNLDYPDYEIILVNDGSTDNTSQILSEYLGFQKALHSNVKISLINKLNAGKAKALNAGIQFSNADFFVFMDGDSLLSKNCLKYGMRHFKDAKIGAVAGNVKVLNRKKIVTDLQALEYLEGLNLARSAQGLFNLVNIIPGPMGFFRKKAIIDAGYYSSDTFAEDADITLKILSHKWQIYYEPNAKSYTIAPEKLHQLLGQRYRWTRGILQAMRKHKKFLYNPTISLKNTLILWTMFYESLIWPVMNIFANVFFIVVALVYGMSSLLFLWWIGITLLDLIAAVYCVAAEKEEFRLVPYALIYRLFYILIIDITKAMATIEEFLGLKMKWGKTHKIKKSKERILYSEKEILSNQV